MGTGSRQVTFQSRSRQVAVTVSIMPDTVDTAIWADDGWRYHPKHVERFVDVNKLYIVASCWIIIDKYYYSILQFSVLPKYCQYCGFIDRFISFSGDLLFIFQWHSVIRYIRLCLGIMFNLLKTSQAKPSQSVNWGRRLARSASRRPPVCYPFLRLTALLGSVTDS